MYIEQVSMLSKTYKRALKDNDLYKQVELEIAQCEAQLNHLEFLSEGIKQLGLTIALQEKEWRDSILSLLEREIIECLSKVYPMDGYVVNLSARVLRGKVHIEVATTAIHANKIPGKLSKTQGRLFQQIVSIASLAGVMELLGTDTIYIDEAFSGSSRKNIPKAGKVLDYLRNKGFNIVVIAQDMNIANNIPANILILDRTVDNKTSIVMNEVF